MFSFCLKGRFPSSKLKLVELVQCNGLDHIVSFLQLPNLHKLRSCRKEVDLHLESRPEVDATGNTLTSKLEVMRFHTCSSYSAIILMHLSETFPACICWKSAATLRPRPSVLAA